MKFINKNWRQIIILSYLFILPVVSFGTNCDPTSGKICNPLQNSSTVSELIHNVLIAALTIGIPIIALAIIYSGFLFVFARGNTEKLTKAKDALLYTLIGAAILLGSWAIATLIQTTVNAL